MKTKEENVENVQRCQRRKKLFAVESFGGKCQICGYDKCIDALEFHHIDKSTKKEKPSYVIMRWSWENAKKELDKCILLCSNCHKEIHFKELNTDIVFTEKFLTKQNEYLIKYVKPWLEKKCKYCDKTYSTKSDIQIYCSKYCKSLDERKVERPSKEELKQLIDDKISWVQLGKMFGVSNNAVKKWAKRYNLLGSKL